MRYPTRILPLELSKDIEDLLNENIDSGTSTVSQGRWLGKTVATSLLLQKLYFTLIFFSVWILYEIFSALVL